MTQDIGWAGVARLVLVQACMGAVVVLCTSTLNRVMVVELGLAAVLPGLMVALHYLVQISRPRMGHGSDTGGRRTPWIIGGMLVLALGGMTATLGTVWAQSDRLAGLMLAVLGFVLIGTGVSACGTNVLVTLAKSVPDHRRQSLHRPASRWALDRHCMRSGPSRQRGALPSSSSSRCWPTAPRT